MRGWFSVNRFITGATLAVVVALVITFALRSQVLDNAEFATFTRALSQLENAESRLDEELLLARTGGRHHLDALVAALARMQALHDQLKAPATGLPVLGDATMDARLLESTKAVETKREAVERFKTAHVFRRSTMLLLPRIMVKTSDALDRESPQIARLVDRLYRDVITFNHIGTDYWGERAVRAEEVLARRALEISASGRETVLAILRHLQLLREQTRDEARYSNEAVGVGADVIVTPLAERMLKLSEDAGREADEHLQRIYLLSALGLLLLIYAVVRMRIARSQLARLAAFPQLSPNPVIGLDRNADIIYSNDTALSHMEALEAGQSILPHDIDERVQRVLLLGEGETSDEYEIAGETWLAALAPVPEHERVNAYLLNITERLIRERFVTEQNQLLGRIAQGDPVHAVLSDLCQMVDAQISDGMASVLILQGDGETLGDGVAPRWPRAFAEAFSEFKAGEGVASCGTAVAREDDVIVTDINTDPLWAPYRDVSVASGVMACWSMPMKSQTGQILGTFAVSHPYPRAPSDRQLELMRNATALASIAVEQNATREAHRLSEESIRALYAVASTHEAGFTGRLQSLLRMGCTRLEMANGVLARADGDRWNLIDIVSANPRASAGESMPMAGTFSESIFERDEPIGVERVAESEWADHPAHLQSGYGAFIGCPVHVGTRIYGVLNFYSPTPRDVFFKDADYEVLRLMAEWLGGEIERLETGRALVDERERALVTLQSIGDGVITTDAKGMVTYLNSVAEKLTGWALHEAHDHALTEVFDIADEVTGETSRSPFDMVIEAQGIVHLSSNTLLRKHDGTTVAIEDSAAPIRAEDGNLLGVVVVFHDVSEQRQLSHELSYQASHDELTGLMNRREFERRLTHAINDAKQADTSHALLYLDLDQFKVVNDTSGHMAGDELLRQLAHQLHEAIRGNDPIARLGGDEFGVLLEMCPLPKAEQLAEKLRETVQNFSFQWEGTLFSVGVSIGLVMIDHNSETMNRVLSTADMACYAAKDGGRNRVHVSQLDDVEVQRRQGEMEWVGRLRDAMAEDRLVLFRQPIVPVTKRAHDPGHCELLLRLRDEEGQLLGPGAFIPAAERFDMMPSLDRWVIDAGLRHYHGLARNQSEPSEIFGINLSGASLTDPSMLDYIRERMRWYETAAESVCFEITETAAIANLSRAVALIETLRAEGCRFALDDFGTGLSSYGYLKNFPVDYLKIDGSFVKDITTDPVARSIVASINDVAHVMGIETVAEWVEDEAALDVLREIGVDHAQGWHVGEPAPLDEMELLV